MPSPIPILPRLATLLVGPPVGVLAVLLGLIVLVVLADPTPVRACSCAQPPPPDLARTAATAVFEGHVLSVATGKDPTSPRTVALHVVRTFKGADSEQVTLTTPASGAACGYGFEPGKSYLVYADGTDGALTAALCSRTRPMSEAAEDLAVLGMGATPVDPNGPGATPDDDSHDSDSSNGSDDNAEPPARGGCAGCALTDTRTSLASAWPALLALALVRRRRDRRA